jgi:uncharacterized protein YjbJ (UPF0337 family)
VFGRPVEGACDALNSVSTFWPARSWQPPPVSPRPLRLGPNPLQAPPAAWVGSGLWCWPSRLAGRSGIFSIRNKRSVTSSTGVDRDRVAGSAEYAKGSVKDAVGSVVGDAKLQAEGKLDKAQGRTQNTVGGITLRGK